MEDFKVELSWEFNNSEEKSKASVISNKQHVRTIENTSNTSVLTFIDDITKLILLGKQMQPILKAQKKKNTNNGFSFSL